MLIIPWFPSLLFYSLRTARLLIAMSTLPSPVVAPKIVKAVKASPEAKVLERVAVDLISAGTATLGIAPGMTQFLLKPQLLPRTSTNLSNRG